MTDTKKSDDIPVTKKMLDETRDELKSDIASVRLEMKAGFSDLKSDIGEIKSEMKSLTAAVHRSLALHEEQNARNKYVLDGYQGLHDRQDRFETEIKEEISEIKSVITKLNTTN